MIDCLKRKPTGLRDSQRPESGKAISREGLIGGIANLKRTANNSIAGAIGGEHVAGQ